MSLSFPPIPPAFLELFGEGASVIWESPASSSLGNSRFHPCQGIFGIVVKPDESSPVTNIDLCSILSQAKVPVVPPHIERQFDVVHELQMPPAFNQPEEPPKCLHGQSSVRRLVSRKDSVNIGRYFFTCPAPQSARCGFFRWADELCNYSDVQLVGVPMTADDVLRETSHVSREMQLRAWKGVTQGSDEWHNLRRVRITASNFGSIHNTNTFNSPTDLLRNILWPFKSDSVAMRYGSINARVSHHADLTDDRSDFEKVGIQCISMYLGVYGVNPDLPIFVDEPDTDYSSFSIVKNHLIVYMALS